MSNSSEHVLPNANGGWSVVRSGSSRASKVFRSQPEAVRYARGLARRTGSDLVVHRRDFTVGGMESFEKQLPERRAKR
jgi:hypothetical protein